MYSRNLLQSLKHAIRGVGSALQTQRNMRIHFLIAAIVLIFGIFLGFSLFEFIIVTLCIITVLIAEIVNTIVEMILDLQNGKKFHPTVKLIKDMAAACVLIAALASAIIGLHIFLPKILNLLRA